MSSIMRDRSGLMGRGEVSEVIGVLSRAEGCWTFNARDRMPRPSRPTAHHVVENAPTETRAPLPRERVRSWVVSRHSASMVARVRLGWSGGGATCRQLSRFLDAGNNEGLGTLS